MKQLDVIENDGDMESSILEKLTIFHKSAIDLLESWIRSGNGESSGYPFEDDFETVVIKIRKWVESAKTKTA